MKGSKFVGNRDNEPPEWAGQWTKVNQAPERERSPRRVIDIECEDVVCGRCDTVESVWMSKSLGAGNWNDAEIRALADKITKNFLCLSSAVTVQYMARSRPCLLLPQLGLVYPT